MDRPDPEYPDPDGDHTLSARRSHLAKHLDKIRKGKAVPKQKLLTPKDTESDDYEDHNRPRRSGPGSDFDSRDDRTHAEFTGDTKADIMSSRGVEADDYRADAEKAIRGRERQALRSRKRSQRQQASTELIRGSRLALAEAILIALEERKQLTRSQVRQAKLEKKGRRLAKKGGKVKGITVSKEAMKHLTDRKPGQGSTPMKPADVVRQLKLTGQKHNKGQIAADAEHGRTTGTALVRKRSEIPDEDVVKTSTVMKKDAGQDVPVTNVQTNKPESAYKTTKGFSAAGPKDPRFMKNVPKHGRARKKFLSGKTLYTAAPGESAPRVGDWGKSGHVTITPKKESIQTARLALAEKVLDEMYETTDDQWEKFNKATGHVSAAEKLRKGAEAAGERFDKITADAKQASKSKKSKKSKKSNQP